MIVLLAVASTLLIGGLSIGGHRARSIALGACNVARTDTQTVQVSLYDGGAMMGPAPTMLALSASPSSASAGRITFVATNYGQLSHEFLVLPLPSDGIGNRLLGANGKINEATSLGEASTSCAAGAGTGITPGARSWIILNLRQGEYELLCDVPWHYAGGMYALFTVR